MKMKLRVPFLCVALLSVGIMPVAAGPRSFSEGANSDSPEAAPAIAPDPSSVNPSKENDRTQWWAIPSVIPSQKPIAEKPSSESEELEAKVFVENQVQKLNSDLTVASKYKRNIQKSSSKADGMPVPQGELKISSNSDRASANPDIEPITDIPKLNDIDRPSTSVEGLLQQSPSSFIVSDAVRISQSVVQITGVKLNPTGAGLEVILETEAGQLLQAVTRTEGKSAIADIENAQLALPSGEEFRAQNPDRGIAEVTVTQLEGSRIRVTVTGERAAPPAQVVKSDRGLVLSVTPENSDAVEIVVTATRTAEVIQNIPRSVTVITRSELEQQTSLSRNLQDIIGREVPGLGAATQSRSQGGQNLRGRNISFLVDGVPISPNTQGRALQTIAPDAIERIEVVRGPNAIYGSQATGGTINIITRRPSETRLSQQSEVGLTAAAGNRRFLESGSFGNYIAHSLSGTEGAYN
jgi:iron complex outermembrane receptor protein